MPPLHQRLNMFEVSITAENTINSNNSNTTDNSSHNNNNDHTSMNIIDDNTSRSSSNEHITNVIMECVLNQNGVNIMPNNGKSCQIVSNSVAK